MMSLHAFTSILGIGLAGIIFLLVRRGHLHAASALFWLATAITALLLGLRPSLIDYIATVTGIAYPPTLLIMCGMSALLIKSLHTDVKNTKLELQLRRLNQRLAMSELSRHNID
jgi:hypothetical protein